MTSRPGTPAAGEILEIEGARHDEMDDEPAYVTPAVDRPSRVTAPV